MAFLCIISIWEDLNWSNWFVRILIVDWGIILLVVVVVSLLSIVWSVVQPILFLLNILGFVILTTVYIFQVEKAQVIQTLLFVAGVNTLLQTWFGTRLPVVIGGSFRFIIPAVFIALSNRYNTYIDPREVGIVEFLASFLCFCALP